MLKLVTIETKWTEINESFHIPLDQFIYIFQAAKIVRVYFKNSVHVQVRRLNQPSNLIIWVDPNRYYVRQMKKKVRRLNQALVFRTETHKVSVKVKEDGFIHSWLNQCNFMVNVLYLPVDKLILKS